MRVLEEVIKRGRGLPACFGGGGEGGIGRGGTSAGGGGGGAIGPVACLDGAESDVIGGADEAVLTGGGFEVLEPIAAVGGGEAAPDGTQRAGDRPWEEAKK